MKLRCLSPKIVIGAAIQALSLITFLGMPLAAPEAPVNSRDFDIEVSLIGPPPGGASNKSAHLPMLASANDWTGLLEYYNINEKCDPNFSIEIDVPPKHGVAKIVGVNFSSPKEALRLFSQSYNGKPDPRGRCKISKFPARLVIYKPDPGYSGDDEVIVVVRDGENVRREDLLPTVPRS